MDRLIASLAVIGFVVVLFLLGDRLLARDRRLELGGWLIDELPADARVDSLPRAFIEWFDRLFRTRRVQLLGVELHLPRFGRSALASFLALGAAFVVWLANKDGLSQPLGESKTIWTLGLLYGGAAFLTNIIPDYLSLVESRFVLGKMSQTRSVVAKLGWLAVDAVSTCAIVFCFLWASGWLFMPLVPEEHPYLVGCLTRETLDFSRMVDITIAGLTFSTPPGTINYDASGVYIYSSFFTSFWVWLYLASSVLVRAAQLVPGLRSFLRKACRVQDYPLRVLAVVSGLVALVLCLVPPVLRPLLPEERQRTNSVTEGNAAHIELCQRSRSGGYLYYPSRTPPPEADWSNLDEWASELSDWARLRRDQLELERSWRF